MRTELLTGMTIEHSRMLYGIAILLMLYHHLFGVNLYGMEYYSLLGPMEYKIAGFCKICVAVYAFITGYGLCRKNEKQLDNITGISDALLVEYKQIAKSILKFYRKYWLVFIFLIPISMSTGLVKINNLQELFYNFIGIQSSYATEWWYVRAYISMLLFFPLLDVFFHKNLIGSKRNYIIILSVLSLITITSFLSNTVHQIVRSITHFIHIKYIIIFIEGYICARFHLFEKIYIHSTALIDYLILAACIFIRFILAKDLGWMTIDMYLIIPVIYSLCTSLSYIKIRRCLLILGSLSVFMWLCHNLLFYILTPIITISHISTLIYLELILISASLAFFFVKLEQLLCSMGR